MKRHIKLLALTVLVLSLFACNWEMPTAVEVVGSRSFSLVADLNLGKLLDEEIDKMLEDMEENTDGLSIIPTTQTNPRVYIIAMEMDLDPVSLDDILDFIHPDLAETLANFPGSIATLNELLFLLGEPQDQELLLAEGDETIPGLNFEDDLSGFSLSSDVDARVYITSEGTNLASIISIEFEIDGEKDTITGSTPSNLGGFNKDNPYNLIGLQGGKQVDILAFQGEEFVIDYKVFIDPDQPINADWLGGELVFTVEIAVWLPMVLEVTGTENAGFEFGSDFLEDGEDLFDSMMDGTKIGDFIESFNIGINLSKSIVTGNAYFLIENDTDRGGVGVVSIRRPLSGTSLSIGVNANEMEQINAAYPFIPKYELVFEPGVKFSMPGDLIIQNVSFSVRIRLRYEFDDTSGGN